ncbi:AGAP002126-PA-like protein [Anopheles sinensis]|uniref:AGAP002126-PA-like protein n=1 Tax=Anopheles sinensis TaxID=74873 RepID=A0A084VJA6_ANOSI|nr:AGAP002126-PA-like protein [Anopheles sinensis]
MAVYLFTLTLNMFVMQTFEQLVLYTMYIVFTEIVMVMKAFIAYYNFDRIYNLYHGTIADAFQPKDELERKLYRAGIGEIKYYSYLYVLAGNLAVGSSLLYLLHKDYRMPYFPWMFGIEYGPEARMNYGIIFGYQVLGMYFHMLVTVAVDVQLCYLLGMIAIHLDLLDKRFRMLSTSQEFQHSFIELVQQYEMVHRMVREVQQLYSPAFFVQFSASGLVICATAFKASSMINLYELTAIQNLLYMLAMMFQMFLPCRFGNEVTRKSNALRTAVYSSQWYGMRLRERKFLHMLLQRMNKPFTLRGYHFFNYNLPAYTSTLNMAYSVYALLQRMALKRS